MFRFDVLERGPDFRVGLPALKGGLVHAMVTGSRAAPVEVLQLCLRSRRMGSTAMSDPGGLLQNSWCSVWGLRKHNA